MCVALIPDKDEEYLRSRGVKDSKLIERNRLHRLAKELMETYKYKVVKIKPHIISKADNLNLLEIEYVIKLIKWINQFEPENIYMDCLTANVNTCWNYFLDLGFRQDNLKIVPKADEKIISVQAASIIAKYHSDKEIEHLQKKYPDMGSGEPSDKKTIEFLKKHLDNPPLDCVRTSWITFKRLKQKQESD